MKIDLYLKDGKMNKAVKEKNHFKEDLKSLAKGYVTLSKSSKSRRLGKLLAEWEVEITIFGNELHQWKKMVRANKEKLIRTRALVSSTY